MSENKCSECGAYHGHSPLCSLIDFETAKQELKRYYELWLNREIETRKREATAFGIVKKAWEKSAFWEGKFRIVKNENNKLRKKLLNHKEETI